MDKTLTKMWNSLEELTTDFVSRLPYVVVSLIVFYLFYLGSKVVRWSIRNISSRYWKAVNVGLVVGRLSQGAIVLVGLLVALSIALPSFNPADIVQLLGIGSVAVGFAFRDILQNFLAGILILITEPFHIGDQIRVNNYEGTVVEIQTRATFIKTYDGRRVVIPNGDLFTNSVTVNTAFPQRRSEYDIGIGYGDDIDRARRLILETIAQVPSVVRNPAPDALVMELADSSVIVRARWWSDSTRSDVLNVQDQVLTAIKNRLVAEGVDLPFPTQVVLFHDQTEETDGDRSRQREGWPAGPGEVPKPRPTAQSVPPADGTTPGREAPEPERAG